MSILLGCTYMCTIWVIVTADEARSSVKVLSLHRGRRVHSYNSCRFEYLSIGNSKVMQRLRHGQPEGSRENMRRGEKEEPRQAEISRLGTETTCIFFSDTGVWITLQEDGRSVVLLLSFLWVSIKLTHSRACSLPQLRLRFRHVGYLGILNL